MGQTGIITEEYKGEENVSLHDISELFRIYRAVSWNMQMRLNQVEHQFRLEYGTDVDGFLDKIYQAGMNIDTDLANLKPRIEIINRSNQFLKLIDEAVDLMKQYHPHGEKYYWVLYYTYMSAYQAENVEEILDELAPHFPNNPRIHRTTYFRWRDQAFEAAGRILWGYEEESKMLLKHFQEHQE